MKSGVILIQMIKSNKQFSLLERNKMCMIKNFQKKKKRNINHNKREIKEKTSMMKRKKKKIIRKIKSRRKRVEERKIKDNLALHNKRNRNQIKRLFKRF